MKHRMLLLLFAGVLVFACNFPTAAPELLSPAPATESGAPQEPISDVQPTFTPLPTLTPTATIIPTPSAPQVTPISAAVNCRSGPDVNYDAISAVSLGQTAQITGRNEDSSWWYVRDPNNPSNFCWVSASVVTTAGNLSGIPLVALPAAIVTKVTVDASVASPVYCGGPNTIMFSGMITTNGPTKVEYQWEIRGDKSNTTAPETINFKSANTKDAPDPGAYTADCGNYSITLHVLSPNDMSAKQNFKVEP